jgi:hypothetical protein
MQGGRMFTSFALCRELFYALLILVILLLSYVGTGCNSKQEPQVNRQSLMAVSGKHNISLDDAVRLTKNFRTSAPSAAVLAESFDGVSIRELLDQKDCVGVRIYYGKKDDGSPALVLVGTDSTGEDMTAGMLLETGWPCPPICPNKSALNK